MFSEFPPFLWQDLRVGFPWGTLLSCLCWPPIWKTIVTGFPELGGEGGLFMLSGSQGPFVSLTSLERDPYDSMADQIFSSSNGQDWRFIFWSYFWIGLQFLLMALFPLASWMQPLWLPPSMKVVPKFFPVARNFLLRAFRMFWWTQGKGFPFAWFRTLVCAVLFQYNSIGKVLCSLRRKAVDRKGQSGTHLKIPYGICPFLLRPKNVSNLRLFSTFLPFLFLIPGER